MSDFQKAISALRGLGIGVTVENIDNIQHAKIEGNGLSGYFRSAEEVKEIKIIAIDEDAYNCIHDRYYDVYGVVPNEYDTIIKDIYNSLPNRIKLLAEEWGWSDTEVREKVSEFIKGSSFPL